MGRYTFLKANSERVGSVIAVVVGLLALLLGWVGVSGKGLTTQQIPYVVSGAGFGLFALGIGATLWISAALRDEWRKLDDIHSLLAEDDASRTAPNYEPSEFAVPDPSVLDEMPEVYGRAAAVTARSTGS
jgi:hypothetical protein